MRQAYNYWQDQPGSCRAHFASKMLAGRTKGTGAVGPGNQERKSAFNNYCKGTATALTEGHAWRERLARACNAARDLDRLARCTTVVCTQTRTSFRAPMLNSTATAPLIVYGRRQPRAERLRNAAFRMRNGGESNNAKLGTTRPNPARARCNSVFLTVDYRDRLARLLGQRRQTGNLKP